MGTNAIRVTVWNENFHERTSQKVAEIYPDGIHGCIAAFLEKAGMQTRTATLEMPEHGLTEEVLNNTDVLIWWGHMKHKLVSDEVVERVYQRVQDGMGLILLHSAHGSKIFERLCGTRTGLIRWRESNDKEILWVVEPGHPIAEGLGESIQLESEETYGENFNIPTPNELVFISWFSGGEVLRSGCCYRRGLGRIFYFQPGHESYPTYYNPEIQKVICNAVRWAAPPNCPIPTFGKRPSILKQEKE